MRNKDSRFSQANGTAINSTIGLGINSETSDI